MVSGSDDVVEQAAVALLNRCLGAEGSTLRLDRPSRVNAGGELTALMSALRADSVGVAIFLGVNPVELAPEGAELAERLAAVPTSVAISERPTATVSACSAIAAAHHPPRVLGRCRSARRCP